ncbi:WD40 repeat domain-containing protein [Dactylosporangium sp. NPDC048998]|uniref:WD40 repeat domain-containing protein n=1 Tax=Dactylosporangium sp. NPDC048998 TaxID=3363976 RepID=UPI00371D4DC8
MNPKFGAVGLSSGGRTAAGGTDSRTCPVWETESGLQVVKLSLPDPVTAVAWRPGGEAFVAGGETGGLWSWPGGVALYDGRAAVRAVSWRGDGHRVAWGDVSGVIRVADGGLSSVIARIETRTAVDGFGSGIRGVAWHPDGTLVAACSQTGRVQVWDVESRRLVRAVELGGAWLAAVTFSPDGERLAVGGRDGVVWLWHWAADGTARALPAPHVEPVLALRFDSGGERLISAGMDRLVRVRGGRSGEAIADLRGLNGWVRAVEFGMEPRQVLAVDGDGVVATWVGGAVEPARARRWAGPEPSWPGLQAAWAAEAARFPWASLRCGCARGARHVPESFAAYLAEPSEEAARRLDIEGDVESQGLLYEAAVPVARLAMVALDRDPLPAYTRARLLNLLVYLVTGDSAHTEIGYGRADLDAECTSVVRADVAVVRRHVGDADQTVAQLAAELLNELGERR